MKIIRNNIVLIYLAISKSTFYPKNRNVCVAKSLDVDIKSSTFLLFSSNLESKDGLNSAPKCIQLFVLISNDNYESLGAYEFIVDSSLRIASDPNSYNSTNTISYSIQDITASSALYQNVNSIIYD